MTAKTIITSADSLYAGELHRSSENFSLEAYGRYADLFFRAYYDYGTAAQREEKRAKSMLRSLYEYFIEHPDELPDDYFVLQAQGEALERIACDYVAGMTDRYSIAVYKSLFIPKSWNKIED